MLVTAAMMRTFGSLFGGPFLGLGAFELTPSPFPGSDVDFPDMRDHSRIALGILDLFRGGKPLLPH